LTLTGVGGTGKTRLALQGAAESLERFPDGVFLIELAALTDPALLLSVVTTTLGLREDAARTARDVLLDYLRHKTLLLLLDTCDTLTAAWAARARATLQRCPRVGVLATSREGLGIAGETLYAVPSLSQPAATETPASILVAVAESDSGRLFRERAQAVLL